MLDILKRHLGLEKEKRYTRPYDDLDILFGRWSEEDFKRIQNKVDDERCIDEELWK